MNNKIRTIGHRVTKASLVKLGVDEELDGFMVVCFWKNGELSAGWSNMHNTDLALGLLMMDKEVKEKVWRVEDDI